VKSKEREISRMKRQKQVAFHIRFEVETLAAYKGYRNALFSQSVMSKN